MQYKLLDVMKFFMALVVVGIHAKCFAGAKLGDTMQWFMSLAVPFFFAASGFLLECKTLNLKSEQSAQSIYGHYIGKCLERYLFWMLLYLPLSVLVAWYNSKSMLHDIAVYIRGFLFVGETYYSWPLWYLLALVIAVLLVRILRKWRVSLFAICMIGMVLNGLAWLYDNADRASFVGVAHYLDLIYKLVFTTTRNGFFVGLACVSLGMMAAHLKNKLHQLFPVMLIVASFLLYKFKWPFSVVLGGWGIMLLSICNFYPPCNILNQNGLCERRTSSVCKYLRNQSVWIYFTHMYILVFLKYTFHIKCLSVYELWLVAILLTIGFSTLLIALSKTERFRWLKYLQ